MNRWNSAILLILALVPASLIGGTAAAPSSATNDIAIVVPASNPVNNLTMAELRRIYMGERKYWKSGNAVVVLMRARPSLERGVMLRVVFQMEEDQYAQYWVGKIMQAEATTPPADLFSSGMVGQGVENIAGAIGYMNSKDVRAGKLKVVRIGGLLPGDKGYPLR
jgi:ABC-type phosphate transport system substrate-binding protein